jgi:hypothetical protein
MRGYRRRWFPAGAVLGWLLAITGLAAATWPLMVWQSSQGHPSGVGWALEVVWLVLALAGLASGMIGLAVWRATHKSR